MSRRGIPLSCAALTAACLWAGGVGAFAVILQPATALAQPAEATSAAPAPPSQEAKKAAAAAFDKGEQAYGAANFAGAGTAFEEAYSHVPHPSALWNAARAWNRAGELARAANLYDKYLKEAPESAPDRKSVVTSLDQIAGKLGRLEIYAPGVESIEVDEHPATGKRVYVSPGTHIIRGRLKGKILQRTQAIEAGGVASVALVDDTAPSTEPKTTGQPPPPAQTPDIVKPSGRPLPPVVVIAGGALTALGLGITIWSGLDTLSARDTFDKEPTQENLDAGASKQTRTNVLLGVTLGAAALTGAAALFFVDWSPASSASSAKSTGSAKVRLGYRTVHVVGSF